MGDFHTPDHNFKCCAGENTFSCLDQFTAMTMAYEENIILVVVVAAPYKTFIFIIRLNIIPNKRGANIIAPTSLIGIRGSERLRSVIINIC